MLNLSCVVILYNCVMEHILDIKIEIKLFYKLNSCCLHVQTNCSSMDLQKCVSLASQLIKRDRSDWPVARS